MNLRRMFSPKSVAIVGVSQNEKKVGYLVAKNMLEQGFAGDLYFIHPTATELLGKKVYPDLRSIGAPVDVVVLAIPAQIAVSYLDQIAEIGCQNVVIFAAGFGETHSPESAILENELHVKIQALGITVLGPNCIGFINTKWGVNATFFAAKAPRGGIGIISQSGALGSALLDYVVTKTHLGISTFLSLGNKAMINESDCLTHLSEDPETKVIGIYLEDVKEGKRFRAILQDVARKKPIIMLKSGRTKEGSQAAMSHTGSMVGDDGVFDSVIKETGAVRADSYAEFEMLLKLYSLQAVPVNRRILVLSNAGGMGVLLADELVAQGLELVTMSEETTAKLATAFDDTKKITVHNPIDLLGDASAYDYEKAINLTMQEQNIGGVIVLLTPQANTEILETAQVLEKIYNTSAYKPLYPVFMGKESVKEAHSYFEKAGMASFRYFAHLPKVLAKMCDAQEVRSSPSLSTCPPSLAVSLSTNQTHIRQTLITGSQKQVFLNQPDSLHVLKQSGIVIAPVYHAVSERDLKQVISQEGYPLVAKLASDKITHKTEVSGVITGITVWEELSNAFKTLTSLTDKRSGCFLQKQYKGHELIIGAKRDLTFGSVVMVGLGGIYAELLKETKSFVFPFSFPYFEHALHQSKLHTLTSSFRSMPPLELNSLYAIAMRIGLIMDRFPEVSEIDINPLIISTEGPIAVDTRVICRH